MQQESFTTTFKQIDSYSALVSSKYFKSSQDFINLMCVCKKFKETTGKLRFNPIPIKSMKLFPNIQTQYLYSRKDKIMKNIDNYEIMYEIDYDYFLKFKKDNIKYRYIVYTHYNKIHFSETIPKEVNILGKRCFGNGYPSIINSDASKITKIDISKIMALGDRCFLSCDFLTSINLSPTLKLLDDGCFGYCISLRSIHLPSTLTSLGDRCFYGCYLLSKINLPSLLTSLGDDCFCHCKTLKSIDLPSSLTSLNAGCFGFCSSLKSIDLPTSLVKFGRGCFYKCDQLINVITVPKICFNSYVLPRFTINS
ncbi:Leucine rich repeat protein [Entamoeba marina]